MLSVKVTEKGYENWERIANAFSKDYDIFVGLPNTGQRYPYRAYEYGPQKKKSTHKKQSRKAKTSVDENDKPFPLIAEVGFWNEFGTEDGRIPERSFLRATVIENAKKYIALNVKVVQRVFAGTLDLLQGLQRIGIVSETDVKKAIKDFNTPPNAPSTIKKKGIDSPLKYKGVLAQSIRSFVKRK
jgi:hypothetical protein